MARRESRPKAPRTKTPKAPRPDGSTRGSSRRPAWLRTPSWIATPAWAKRSDRATSAAASPTLPHVRRGDRFTVQDLLVEASYGIGARPSRLVMTTLGTVLGIASLVVTIGFAQTAAGQISSQFDAVATTQVVVEPGSTRTASGSQQATARLPWDSESRVIRLAGVEKAGLVADVPLETLTVTSVPVNDPSAPQTASPPVLAATAGLLDAVRGEVVTGRFFDAGHNERGDRVVVLGERAAEALGINRVDSQPSIFIGERSYTVIGIVDSMQRRPDMLDSVILPMGTARIDFDLAAPQELQIQIAVGAGKLVSAQAPVALDPNAPETFDVTAPRTGSQLQDDIQADVNIVFLILGAIALLAGGLGIANVTLLSVMERVSEIGLRRALGATRKNIAQQFIVESVVIGLLGGLIGSALGVAAVVAVSLIQGWTPILDPLLAIGAALLGALVGLAAGAYPALRASNIEPIVALRGS